MNELNNRCKLNDCMNCKYLKETVGVEFDQPIGGGDIMPYPVYGFKCIKDE